MKVVVLASGSDGNSTFISSGNHKILIDLGRNAKYIKEHLKEIDEDASDIEAIIISHTHKDHTSALKVFLNQYHPMVYLTEKQYKDLDFLKDYDNVVMYDEEFLLKFLRFIHLMMLQIQGILLLRLVKKKLFL